MYNKQKDIGIYCARTGLKIGLMMQSPIGEAYPFKKFVRHHFQYVNEQSLQEWYENASVPFFLYLLHLSFREQDGSGSFEEILQNEQDKVDYAQRILDLNPDVKTLQILIGYIKDYCALSMYEERTVGRAYISTWYGIKDETPDMAKHIRLFESIIKDQTNTHLKEGNTNFLNAGANTIDAILKYNKMSMLSNIKRQPSRTLRKTLEQEQRQREYLSPAVVAALDSFKLCLTSVGHRGTIGGKIAEIAESKATEMRLKAIESNSPVKKFKKGMFT